MDSADLKPPRTLRLVLVYGLFAACLCVVLGAAVWIMPRLPDSLLLRTLVGVVLFGVLAYLWAQVATSLLPEEQARRLLPKRDDR